MWCDKVVESGTPVRFVDEHAGLHLDHSIHPLFDRDGRVERLAVFSRDITEQKRALDALGQSEEKYRTIIENIEDGYYEVDVKGNFTIVNPSTARMFGRSEDQLVGRHFGQFTTPDEAERLFKAYRKVWTVGEPLSFDALFLAADGTERRLELSGSLVKDSEGHRQGFRGVARDITQRLRAEQALRQSEETARALLNATTDAAFLIDTNGKVLALNEVAADRLGLTVQELVGHNLFKLFPTDLASERRNWCDKVVESGKPVRFVDTEAGLYLDNSVHPLFDRDGKVERLAIFSRDITEQKRAVDALQESEEKYRTIIENIEDGYYEVDVKGNFTLLNPSTARLFGRSEEEIAGQNFGQFTIPDEAGRIFNAYHKVWTTGEPARFDALFLAADGSERRLELSVSLIRDSGGHRRGFRGVARDITERLRAEQALRQSEETARALLNATTDAALLIDTEGTVLALNEVAANRSGLTLQELVGRNLFELFPPDLAKQRRMWCDKVVESGTPVRFVDEDAGLHLDHSVHPLFDRYGRVERLAIFSRDITDQKRAVDALRQSEEKYRTLVKDIEEAFYEVDVKGNFTLINQSGARLLGRSEEEMVGQNFGQFTTPDEAPRVFKQFHKVWTTGETARFDALFLSADGSERRFELSVSLVRDEGGHRRGFRGLARDITQRLQDEQALRQSEETARALLDATTDEALLMDSSGVLLALNQEMALRLGLEPQELVGRNLFEFFPRHLARERKVWCDQVITSGSPVRFVDEDAGAYLDHSIHPVFGNSGNVERLAIFSRDITDQVQAEETLRKAKEAAEAADRAKSDFLANMSHELRTPLNAIIALSEVLEDQTFGKLNDTQLEYVGVVLNSGRHLLQLINDILDLAKVESGKLELHLSEVSLRPVLEGSLVMVKEKALKHGLKLELRIGEEITDTVIQADDVKLKQILFNLLSNAAKFTPDGGEIVLDARLGRDELIFSVSDTGIGIRSEDQERIFGEFEQIDSSYARQQQGTGLGLALTRRLVELHGGRIWVESEGEGKGSTFTFTIPIFGPQERKIAAAEESVIPQSIQPESPSLSQLFLDESRPTILVVDDDPTANDVIAHYLSEAGYSVAQAFNADQAIEMARRLVPLAITLDVLMPRISGFDVLIELKSQPDTKDIPVVMVTVVDDRELALSLGAVDFFVKPLDRKRFLGVMRAIESKKANECLKVVVVDDEPYVVETISEILQSRGYEVLRAYSGRQGIDLAVAHLPDVIVLDLLMPQMTGFEVVEQLREHPALRETPIIVYTAKDLTEEDRQRLRAPVRAIASKSDDKKQLLRQLERLLRSDHADDESKGM
jgi:PAS domain S-box-containing protein